MKSKTIILLMLFIIMACGRTSSTKYQQLVNIPEGYSVDNKYPEAGETIKITCTASKFNKESDVYFQIYSFGDNNRWVRPATLKDGKYEADFTVQEGQSRIDGYFTTQDDAAAADFLILPIYKSGQINENELVKGISRARTPEDFWLLKQEAEKLYPDNYDKYFYEWWSYAMHTGLSIDTIEMYRDDLLAITSNNVNTPGAKLHCYSVCALSSAYMEDFETVQRLIDSCAMYSKMTDSSFKYYDLCFNNITNLLSILTRQHGKRISQYSGRQQESLLKLLNILMNDKRLYRYSNLLSFAKGGNMKAHPEIFGPVIGFCLSKAKTMKYPEELSEITVINFFEDLADVLTELNEYDKMKVVMENALTYAVHPTKKELYEKQMPGDLLGYPYWKAAFTRHLVDAMLHTRDTATAVKRMTRYINTETMVENSKFAFQVMSRKLTEYYMSTNQKDSAEKYMIMNLGSKHYYSPKLYKAYSDFLSANGQSVESIEDFVEGHNIAYFPPRTKTPNISIETPKGIINSGGQQDTLLCILFYNDNCPICNMSSVQFVAEMEEYQKYNVKVIVISKSHKQKLYEAYGKNIYICDDDEKYKKHFGIQSSPYCVLIRQGNIIYQSSSMPNSAKRVTEIIERKIGA